jgi:hypothetical protein
MPSAPVAMSLEVMPPLATTKAGRRAAVTARTVSTSAADT